jgi:hypothetical protein
MSSRTLRFYFKIVYTANTWELDVNANTRIADFIAWINTPEGHELFNIHEQYHIQVVDTNSVTSGNAEMAPSIIPSFSDTIGERFNPRNNAFYLRPVHPITEEFIRRDDYSTAPNYTQPEIPRNTSRQETPEINVQSTN